VAVHLPLFEPEASRSPSVVRPRRRGDCVDGV